MAQVVAIHGINNTYLTVPQMAARWGPALVGGVELAGGRLDLSELAYVAYGDVFRPRGRFLGEECVPMLTAEDVDEGLELELLWSWWAAAARLDPRVVPPDARTLGGRMTARAAVLALAGSRLLATVTERILVWWLKQVSAYFTDPMIRAEIQNRFATMIDVDTRVVVAHSLGSVVAYESLCAHREWPVTDLVTLGSPLGVPHVVLHRLVPQPGRGAAGPQGLWPGSVQRWINLTDDGDFVALEPRLRKVFGERVVDVAIANGAGPHNVERYLSAAETGSAVLAGLLDGIDPPDVAE